MALPDWAAANPLLFPKKKTGTATTGQPMTMEEMIRTGEVPVTDPEALLGQFRALMERSEAAGSDVMRQATARAGRVPGGLAGRVGAIVERGKVMAATQMAGITSQHELSKFQSAAQNWLHLLGIEKGAERRERERRQAMVGNIFGSLFTLGMLPLMTGGGFGGGGFDPTVS